MAIYMATHKPAPMPAAPWLVPIGLGGFQDEQVRLHDAQGGDHIAARNRDYCELTATYWLWKHCSDPYIGLCHYRRLFAFMPVPLPSHQSQPIVKTPPSPQILDFLGAPAQEQRMGALLEHFEVIVPQPVLQHPSLAHAYRASHGDAVWSAFMRACRDEFGSVAGMLDVESRFHYGNMLVAHAGVFADYAERLFRVLEKVYAEIGTLPAEEGVRYQPFRYPGYLGERFTNLYLAATRRRFAAVQSIWLE
jgi:hypothetical protein